MFSLGGSRLLLLLVLQGGIEIAIFYFKKGFILQKACTSAILNTHYQQKMDDVVSRYNLFIRFSHFQKKGGSDWILIPSRSETASDTTLQICY
jgi:hypothetical protein